MHDYQHGNGNGPVGRRAWNCMWRFWEYQAHQRDYSLLCLFQCRVCNASGSSMFPSLCVFGEMEWICEDRCFNLQLDELSESPPQCIPK
jgi:hypothetical protein